MKTKRLYQAPLTERVLVELEGGFCASVDFNKTEDTKIESVSQGFEDVGVTDGFETTDGAIKWD
jgi:hypothetical protein